MPAPIEVGDDFPGQAQGVIIVLCEIVGDARDPCMHICTAERLGADFLPGIADGYVEVDDRTIYTGRDLRVGLFNAEEGGTVA